MPQQKAIPQNVLDAIEEGEEESRSWDPSSGPEEPSRLQGWAGITATGKPDPTEFSRRSLLGGDLSWEEYSELQTPFTMALINELPWLLAGGAAAKGPSGREGWLDASQTTWHMDRKEAADEVVGGRPGTDGKDPS